MTQNSSFDITTLFEGALTKLRTEAEYFSRLTGHSQEIGRLNETHLVRLLREYLPPKIGVGTGFIVSGGSNPKQSPQTDIILYDAQNNAPLYRGEAWSLYPVEMVYGVIEVKTKLTKNALQDAADKCEKIRSMCKTDDKNPYKSYIRYGPSSDGKTVAIYKFCNGLPPRFFVFSYSGWNELECLSKNFKAVSREYPKAHIHGVCTLNDQGGYYVGHRAFEQGEDRFAEIESYGFHRWLLNLPVLLESMLPLERQGVGFDLVNLWHYNMSIS